MKCLIVPNGSSDQAFVMKLKEAGFEPHEIQEIFSEVRSPDAFFTDYGNRHLVEILGHFCNCSWMSFEGLSGVVKNESGTLAGMSLADVMFMSAFKRVVCRVKHRMRSAGLIHTIDASGAGDFFNIEGIASTCETEPLAFVDDLLLPIICNASDVINSLKVVACIVCEVFARFAFLPNFGRGKTEALVNFYGKHAKSNKEELFCVMNGCVPFMPQVGHSIVDNEPGVVSMCLRCVGSYKHLGSHRSCGLSILPEIRQKIASATKFIHPLAKRVLRRTSMSTRARISYAQAFLFTRCLFECVAWPRLSISESLAVHSFVMT
eukprot:12232947-Karenia_brevis.AAC.1